jgi:hypothetical protein
MRIESSIMTSLSELRAIEQQRIADERHAFERERAAELEARRAAEQARIDAEERRVREEREAMMRIEQARVDAEREARLRVEAAEAAERARLQAVLDQQRMQDETELRRAEIAKKRPTWMLAVTALALVATVGFGWYAVGEAQDRDRAEQQRIAAENARREAQEHLQEARAELDRLAVQMQEQDAQIEKAMKALLVAQNQADRDRVAAEIRQANQRKADIRRQQAAAEAAAAKAERDAGVDVTKCLGAGAGSICGVDEPKKKKRKK